MSWEYRECLPDCRLIVGPLLVVFPLLMSPMFGVEGLPVSLQWHRLDYLILVTVAGVIFIIGSIIQTATMNKEMMMAGRFFAGLGIGQMVGASSAFANDRAS